MSDVINISRYTIDMSRSLDEKLFFLPSIKSRSFVDYGCANGIIGAELLSRRPGITYRGFDLSRKMVKQGRRQHPTLQFFNHWDELITDLDPSEHPTLILSSIIHEVYSYSTPREIYKFWQRVLSFRWSNVIIRDMIPYDVLNRNVSISADVVRTARPNWMIDSFESRWGSIDIERNLVHLLLKYRYEQDWARELDEDYIPINEDQLMNIVGSNFQVVYYRRNTPRFLTQMALKDVGVLWPANVHLSLILIPKI
jgi:hypothetical protein